MSDRKNVYNKDAVDKLKSLVNDISVCLFCTHLNTDDGSTCRPMAAQKVCNQGNIWFFSEKNSEKNQEIAKYKDVQLFFSHPGKSSYLIVNGEAEIIIDRVKTEELWSPMASVWFTEGMDDPDISIIKVKPKSAYYWDADGNKMISFIKMIASLAIGTNHVTGEEGSINI